MMSYVINLKFEEKDCWIGYCWFRGFEMQQLLKNKEGPEKNSL